MLKRFTDICGALVLLLVTLPIFMVIAVAIKLTSPGPVLFKQKRLGQHGRHFQCYKFRTMMVNSEEILRSNPELLKQFEQGGYKLKSDPRVTKIGAFLRKTSLDEFPQFFNVLFGDMSLIGPRPIVPNEIKKYGDSADKLLCVKPGLGGMWQASGRSDVSYEDRVALDMAYVDNCSFTMDIYLLFMTAMAACQSRGAY
jgi:lipopolysaccharide/colanic/teichoic acid biosynthesis glycosyltransferase